MTEEQARELKPRNLKLSTGKEITVIPQVFDPVEELKEMLALAMLKQLVSGQKADNKPFKQPFGFSPTMN